jgi:hypothetical protein
VRGKSHWQCHGTSHIHAIKQWRLSQSALPLKPKAIGGISKWIWRTQEPCWLWDILDNLLMEYTAYNASCFMMLRMVSVLLSRWMGAISVVHIPQILFNLSSCYRHLRSTLCFSLTHCCIWKLPSFSSQACNKSCIMLVTKEDIKKKTIWAYYHAFEKLVKHHHKLPRYFISWKGECLNWQASNCTCRCDSYFLECCELWVLLRCTTQRVNLAENFIFISYLQLQLYIRHVIDNFAEQRCPPYQTTVGCYEDKYKELRCCVFTTFPPTFVLALR